MDKTKSGQEGFNLVEVMIVVAIIGLVTVIGVPSLLNWNSGLRVEMAAGQLAGAMNTARIHAIRYGANVAVKFYTDPDTGVVTYGLFRDGDGDGVRNVDITKGVDPEVWAPRRLTYMDQSVRFGFPPGTAPRNPASPSRRLDRLDDPIRFGVSDLASFSALGTASPGTVYITDGRRYLAAVRTYNMSGKIEVITYDFEEDAWR